MSLNRSVPQSPNKATNHVQVVIPDYAGLARFLIQPFLESPNSLSVDCEISPNTARVWLRIAFEGEDKGRVFGRGGRNIQAIRSVIAAAAALAEHSVYLDIYGSQPQSDLSGTEEGEEQVDQPKSRETLMNNPKPIVKLRSRSNLN